MNTLKKLTKPSYFLFKDPLSAEAEEKEQLILYEKIHGEESEARELIRNECDFLSKKTDARGAE
jgi:hypothetical protein